MKNSVLITTAFYVLLFLNCVGQDKTKPIIREPVVAGTFYPSNPVELKMQLATFFGVAENKTINENATAIVLLPLAGRGYTCFIVAALNIFSGSLAASIRKKSIF